MNTVGELTDPQMCSDSRGLFLIAVVHREAVKWKASWCRVITMLQGDTTFTKNHDQGHIEVLVLYFKYEKLESRAKKKRLVSGKKR